MTTKLQIAPFLLLWISLLGFCKAKAQVPKKTFYLIAHRGGVVDSTNAENSLPAMKAAFERGYKMVEIDLRLTKDSVFIIQHDKNFKRYYGVERNVTDMTWPEIQLLRSDRGGSRVLSLEAALQYCSGKMEVMIDNKIEGNDSLLFGKLIQLLKKYKLHTGALMIGTDASTDYFRGKIKLSCTQQQLEANMKLPGYSADQYYLFGADLSKEMVDWARQRHILAIGVVNAWRYRQAQQANASAEKDASQLKAAGLTHFQLDTEYDYLFQ